VVREAAAVEKKRLEDQLTEEKSKVVEATTQFNTMATGRLNLYADVLFCEEGRLAMSKLMYLAEFHNREQELKNALAASRSKV
jgi:hypothetical protein